MVDIKYFAEKDFTYSLDSFFKDLNIPIDTLTKQSANPEDIIDAFNTNNDAFSLINVIYPYGIVNDAVFGGDDSLETIEEIKDFKKDYDGLLVFGVVLKQRENNLLPTRSQLTHITRSLNRSFPYTPITVVFKYKDSKHEYIAFANGERSEYSVKWKEGEKIGKVSILRDIRINKTHTAHLRILDSLRIDRNKVVGFRSLYEYWQEVFSTKTLTKQFYKDLSYWYFWAIDNVTFPSEDKYSPIEERIENKSKNVIRLLTRLLFVWFLKQKNLVPKELFDIDYLSNKLLKDFDPHFADGLFDHKKLDSIYYKAILQNLFFATLNCPIQPISKEDTRQRGFRKNDNYGQHRDANFLMRYEKHFSNPEHFLELVNSKVPFLNGGLFDCLDEKTANPPKYIDGFSDNLISPHQLVVPDFLFFGDEKGRGLDMSKVLEDKSKKSVDVKGLIDILKSYYFTVEENTPYDQEVSLDPELLGKVFENLLASYNPETKSTARKQSGSFYTPREIVQYMVDESLIAYLKNNLGERIENEIRKILSYSDIELELSDEEKKDIISSLYNCKILDPACGSGAFPMGILQQIVHIIKVLDNENKYWYELVKKQASFESEEAFNSTEKEKEELLREIGHNFDLNINSADYSRKLYVIENSIYGVDIQPLAVQISKLRFFISLVIEQKSNQDASNNFNIRPLPNLEAKFVAANTLIGIDKKENQLELFETDELRKLQNELKTNRHKIFTSKSPKTKKERKEKDKELRKNLAELLESYGSLNSEEAKLLAGWDMFDQNASSPFFDSEWMFGIKDGFDVVIANPPYIGHKGGAKKLFRELKSTTLGSQFNNERMDIFYYFFHVAINITSEKGIISFITTNYFPTADSAVKLRQDIYTRTYPYIFVDFNELTLFESARGQHNLLSFLSKNKISDNVKIININAKNYKSESEIKFLLTGEAPETTITNLSNSKYRDDQSGYFLIKGIDNGSTKINEIVETLANKSSSALGDYYDLSQGVVSGIDKISPKHGVRIEKYHNKIGEGVFVVSKETAESFSQNDKKLLKPWFKNSDISKYYVNEDTDSYLIHINSEIKLNNYPSIQNHLEKYKDAILSRNYESGELSKAKRKGAWWALSSSRREFDFAKPKIVSPQRSKKNTFGFTQKEWCASADVYFITSKPKAPIPLLAMVLILNSKLFYLWLYNRGKRKGEMLELYLTPLAAIPLPNLKLNEIRILNFLGSFIFNNYTKLNGYHVLFDQITNGIIVEHYFPDHMKERGIDVLEFVDRDINEVMKGREFEKLSDTEKEQVIEALHAKWSHPDNEVRNRIKLFAVRSPEILKPILES